MDKLFDHRDSPFIIAEMSGNHNQSLDKALEIVDAAANAGVDALKIQTYTADTMTLDIKEKEFYISDPKSLWNGKSLYELYQQAHTPWEWHKPIFERCKKNGIIGFSTPFDITAVDFLEELEVPFYKIASFENTDIPLIKAVAQKNKPMIISTGMATVSDLQLAVDTAIQFGCPKVILLKCTSLYPATAKDANLRTIPHLRELFNVDVGLSDHTLGIGVACAAAALGANVIEKHFTLNRSEGGVDSTFSMEPDEMKLLVQEAAKAYQSIGKVSYGINASEKSSAIFKRSLYISEDIKKGQKITSLNMRSIRPGFGLPTKYYDILIDKTVKRDVQRGTPITWDLIE